tara:strand:+ start:16582 stop:17400 length:819 start_codon:yes stop_codon:yes gene_type:complete
MKTLILGAKGMLGTDISLLFPDATQWDLGDVDITNESELELKVKALNPDVIINCAAFTDVNAAEEKQEAANLLNGKALLYIVNAAKKVDAIIVHYSTDYVFDGKQKLGYAEDAPTNPLNMYGSSKALGEKNLTENYAKFYLLRTAWLFGKNGKNFISTMLDLAKTRDELKVVNDQTGSPTYTKDLAQVTFDLLEKKQPFGIYHASNDGSCTWYEFAVEIFKQASVDITVNPCTSDEYPSPAQRPKYSILQNTKLPKLRTWQKAVQAYLEETQ